jgi:hypothetical protein
VGDAFIMLKAEIVNVTKWEHLPRCYIGRALIGPRPPPPSPVSSLYDRITLDLLITSLLLQFVIGVYRGSNPLHYV